MSEPVLSVVAPALEWPSGEPFFLVDPQAGTTKAWRHSQLVEAAFVEKRGGVPLYQPGARHMFLLSNGRLVGRHHAALVARNAGQIDWDPAVTHQELNTEHLWGEDGRALWEQ